ncbi:MAG: hypothetical protein SYR96_04235 [Actinomycetota bacterium]|nr:hypothetical protein [Actinomycetota bacterium]
MAAGFLRDFSRLPPPPGLPSVRAFQRWQADEVRLAAAPPVTEKPHVTALGRRPEPR